MQNKDTWTLGGHTFTSRFILGSGKYNLNLIRAAVEDAGAEIITLALRRVNTRKEENILDYIPEGVTLLPNTSGARNAEEAVRLARLAREMGCGDFVKVEIMHDSKYLLPDNYETIKATEILAKEGFIVMPYMYPDLNAARDMVNAGEACKLASKYFRNVGLEIYPVNVDEYKYLHECGADYITVFQETYNSDKYETLHLMGHKRVWPYRFEAQERALMGGMRGVGFSALLGLDDFRKDALATALHVYYLQRKYPHAEMSLSCPRLRPIINNDKINPKDVHETQLCQILCAYRIFLPYAGITVSSREVARFRDHIIRFAATKISAGVSTGIGDHEDKYTGKENEAESGDEQFEIADNRSLQEIYDAIKDQGLQPVLNEYIYV